MMPGLAYLEGFGPRLRELAMRAPDLYHKWFDLVANTEIPPRGPPESVQNYERVLSVGAAYFIGFELAWKEYEGRQ